MNGKKDAAATVVPASMNGHDDFLVGQKAKLESEKMILQEEFKDLTNPKKINFNHDGDPAWKAKMDMKIVKIRAVDLSLLRIKNGVYEICVGCGKQIEREILEKMTTRKLCCACTEPESPKKRRRF